MAIEVLINAGAGEIRVALVADGKLEELSFERTFGNEIGGREFTIRDHGEIDR